MFKINGSRARNIAALSVSKRFYTFVSIKPEGIGFRLDDVRVGIRSNGSSGDTLEEALPSGYHNTGVTELIEGRCVFSKLIKLPPMSKEEAITTIRITERDTVPFDINRAVIDLWIVNQHPAGMMNVLMVATTEEELNYRKERLRGSSFHLAHLSTAPAAIGALLGQSKLIDKSCQNIFIEIKDSVTQIHIFQNGALVFTREIHFGIGDALDLLMDHNERGEENFNEDGALNILETFGIPDGEGWVSRGVKQNVARGLMQTPMEKIAREIKRTLDYFERGPSSSPVDYCWIIGVGAGIKNIAPWLETKIGIKTMVYNPFDDFLKAPLRLDKPQHIVGPAIAIAVGLAIDNGGAINLPGSSSGKSSGSRLGKAPKRAMSAFAFLLALGLATFSGWSAFGEMDALLRKERQAIIALENRMSGEDYSASRLSTINANIKLLRAKLESYPKMIAVSSDWVAMFETIGRMMPGSMRLTGLNVDISEGGAVVLHGMVKGTGRERLIDVSQLLSDMESSQYFTRAQIINTSKTDDGDLRFVIRSNISGPDDMQIVQGVAGEERG